MGIALLKNTGKMIKHIGGFMFLKNLSFILVLALVFSACQGGLSPDVESNSPEISLIGNTESANTNNSGQATVSEIEVQEVVRSDAFQALSFSEYLFYNAEDNQLLIDWNFFPSTDYNSTAKTLLIPCSVSVSQTTPDGLSFSENVPLTDEPCEGGVLLDLSDATFEAYGLVFDFDDELEVLSDDYNVVITLSGFETADGESVDLQGSAGTLINVLSKI